MKLVDTDAAKELWSGDHPTAVTMRKIFDDLPAVDAAPVVHAHWVYWPRKVYAEDGSYTLAMDTSCSKCNWHIPEGMDSPFCPRCGARMDENIFATED